MSRLACKTPGISAVTRGCLLSTDIGEFAEHFFGVGFGERDAHGGIGLHFGEALADFAFLSTNQDRGLLDFVPMFIEPAATPAPGIQVVPRSWPVIYSFDWDFANKKV
jgi:hypothetical protein